MKSNRYQMLFVFMSVFFFGFINFMVPNISEGNQANFIQKYDKDNDGKLSKEEFSGSDQAFSNLDKNQDGYIDKSEAQKDRNEREYRSKKENRGYIQKYDKDNDGKLSKEEFPGSDKAFSNLDKNQDGYIDKDEAKLATKERSKKEKKGKHDKSNKDKGDDDKND